MNKTFTFNQILRRKEILPTLISSILLFFYAIFFMSMPIKDLKWAIVIEIFILIITILGFIPLEKILFTKKLSSLIENWKDSKETSLSFRTNLFMLIAKFPLKKGTLTFFTYLISSTTTIICFICVPFIHVSLSLACMAYIACFFGSYLAAILAINYTETICSKYCGELVKQGIDKNVIEEKKHFGMRVTLRCFLYLIIPLIFIFAIMYFDIQLKNGNNSEGIFSLKLQLIRVFTITLINIAIYTCLCYLFYKKIKNTSDTIADAIEVVLEGENHKLYIETNIFDSMQYSIYILNEIIANYEKLISKSKTIGQDVLKTTDNLTTIAQNLESTSTDQNSDVQEITATMEDTNISLKNIDSKLANISNAIDSANKEVNVGFDVMNQNINQMDKIENSNNSILKGINNLEDQISEIGKMINKINDIAEQTSIIAFNAELEAVSAGEKGKNFHIIASEIRSLANSIMESIKDIENHTSDIENATQKLTDVSNNTTRFIQEEHSIAHILESRFQNIQISTAETATQTKEISSTVSQQKAAFEQIVTTLNQISSSIRSFTTSTKDISNTATQIQKATSKLNSLN